MIFRTTHTREMLFIPKLTLSTKLYKITEKNHSFPYDNQQIVLHCYLIFMVETITQ